MQTRMVRAKSADQWSVQIRSKIISNIHFMGRRNLESSSAKGKWGDSGQPWSSQIAMREGNVKGQTYFGP